MELRLKLTHLADAKIAALRWGSHAEILAPAELRAELQKSLEQYSAD